MGKELAVGAGGHTVLLFEAVCEVDRCLESHFIGYVGHQHIGGDEQMFSVGDAQVYHIVVQRDAVGCVEHSVYIIRMVVQRSGKCCAGEITVVVGFDVLQYGGGVVVYFAELREGGSSAQNINYESFQQRGVLFGRISGGRKGLIQNILHCREHITAVCQNHGGVEFGGIGEVQLSGYDVGWGEVFCRDNAVGQKVSAVVKGVVKAYDRRIKGGRRGKTVDGAGLPKHYSAGREGIFGVVDKDGAAAADYEKETAVAGGECVRIGCYCHFECSSDKWIDIRYQHLNYLRLQIVGKVRCVN